ncbi:hypothetical protein RV08_GL000824 [Enterococcus mundtii]|nr:hypothetical protein RV08_GL000824 [Enterococcus mundtii]
MNTLGFAIIISKKGHPIVLKNCFLKKGERNVLIDDFLT